MKGDFTRFTFDRKKHYTGIRMQQGRVQLDSDWNEMVDIQSYRMRTESEDFIGPSGAPKLNPGFAIEANGKGLTISPGRMYVDGILCENEKEVSVTEQPDLPGFTLPAEEGLYLAYLEVWHRHITAIEDPTLRELGLGGPDTATRVKTVWQVKLLRVGDIGTAANAESDLPGWTELVAPSIATLRARVQGGASVQLRTSLYRVEVHRVDSPEKVYVKWARDNASTVARWLRQDNNRLTVESVGRNAASDFTPGQWIELTDDKRELQDLPGTLVPVTGVEGDVLTIDQENATVQRQADDDHPKVRRWDSPGANQVQPDGWIELEDGIEVQLAGTPRPGDYWLIPARSFNHDVEWPQGELPPHGIGRHYSRLALVELKDEEFSPREDCRFLFSPLNDLRALTAVRSALNAPDGTIYVDEAGNVGIGTREPSGRLEVRGDIVVREGAAAGNVNVEGNLEVAQTISGNADAHFHRNVSVVGDLTAGQSISTKKVDSDRVDAGTVNVTGDLEVAQTIRGNADAHFAQNVNVAGDLTAARSIITPKLSSDAVDAGKVNVGGDLGVAGPIRGNADAHFAQNVNVAGDLTAARSIITPKLSSDTVDAGTVNFTGDLEVAQTIRGNADAHFAKNVNVAGDLTASRSIITPKLSSDTVEAGKVNVGGDLGVAGPIRGNADAHFAKNVNVAGDLTASRSIITPKLSIDTVDAEKVSVGGDLEVAQTIRGNADAYFHGNVHVAGHLTAAGGIRKVPDEVLASDRVEISSITTATIWVDMRDMGMTIFTKHSRIFILRFHAGGVRGIAPAALFSSASMRAEFRLLVDDSQHAYCMNEVNQKFGDSGSGLPDISLEKFLRLGEGSHTVKVQWSVRSPQARDRLWWAGTNIFGLSYSRWLFERRCHLSISCNDNTRSLTVLEL